MSIIQATRLTSGPAGSPSQAADTKEAVYRLLAEILPGGPHLPDAACRGALAWLWDDVRDLRGGEQPMQRDARHAIARIICQGCPERDTCRAARQADQLLGGGIWAGELVGEASNQTRCVRCRKVIVRGRGSRQKYCAPTCPDGVDARAVAA